jgi:chloramphenicol-sensitive protein RarD
METGIMFLPALGYLMFAEFHATGAFGHTGVPTIVLLLLSGLVTAVPLLLFASGARRVPLSLLGLLQYIAPTLQFLTGVFLFGEPFTQARLIGFSMIWLALIILSAEGYFNHRRNSKSSVIAAPGFTE